MIGTLFGHQSCPSTELATRAIDLGRPSHAPVYAVQMVNKCVLTRMALMCSAKDATHLATRIKMASNKPRINGF